MTIGQRIKNRRIELGLTQEELAKRLGNKSRASVCTVERDKEDLTATRIRQYAKALECSPGYLMGWEDGWEEYIPPEGTKTFVVSMENMKNKMSLTDEEKTIIMELRDMSDAQKQFFKRIFAFIKAFKEE